MFHPRFWLRTLHFIDRIHWTFVFMPKYAVAVGHKPGIYDTWGDCSAQVKGCKGAKFKKFRTEEEAQAFIDEHSQSRKRSLEALYALSDAYDGPQEISMEYESNTPFMHFMAESPIDSKLLAVNSRLSAMEDKLNNFIDKTTKLLENLTARVVKLESVGSAAHDHPQSNKRARMDSSESVFMKAEVPEGDVCVHVAVPEVDVSIKMEAPEDVVSIKMDVPEDNFKKDSKGNVCVYTDGACSSNGRAGAKAGIGVWFNKDHPLNVSAPVKGPPTNNTAEIQAARVAITQAAKAGVKRLAVHTDSKFVINCITKWIHRWKTNGWKLTSGGDVKNKKELVKLEKALQSVDAVEWIYVRGHSGTEGNEMADSLARDGAARYETNVRYADHVDGEADSVDGDADQADSDADENADKVDADVDHIKEKPPSNV